MIIHVAFQGPRGLRGLQGTMGPVGDRVSAFLVQLLIAHDANIYILPLQDVISLLVFRAYLDSEENPASLASLERQ